MVFKLEHRILYKRDVKLKDRTATLYFFSAKVPTKGTPCDLPEGCTVGVNKRTGYPYIKQH